MYFASLSLFFFELSLNRPLLTSNLKKRIANKLMTKNKAKIENGGKNSLLK